MLTADAPQTATDARHRAGVGADASVTPWPDPGSGLHLAFVECDPHLASRAAARSATGPFSLVRTCDEVDHHRTLPGVHILIGRGPRRVQTWRSLTAIEGTGVSTSPEQARLAATAETVERYAAMARPAAQAIVRAAFAEVAAGAVSPGALALLSPRQYARLPQLEPLTSERPVDWCWGISLTRDLPVLVPVGVVYPSLARLPPNDYIAEVTTTGMACHASLPHAILSGLCEVLERDALTIAWANALPVTELRLPGTSVAALLAGPFSTCGMDCRLLEIPTDSPFPVVMAFLSGKAGEPYAAIGAACRPTVDAAAERALLEAGQILTRLRALRPPRPRRIRTFDDHAALYAARAPAGRIPRLLPIRRTETREIGAATPSTATHLLANAVSRLAQAGRETIVVDITPSDVARTGYRVVRVVIPGALDMSADGRTPRLGGRRLYDVPVSLGLRARPLEEREINLMPLPLA